MPKTTRQTAVLPPITFAANEPRYQGAHADGLGQLWSAQIKAVRTSMLCELFVDVLFVESHATAYVLGIEEVDGRPRCASSHLADHQQRFVSFLRTQTRLDLDYLGPIAMLFQGHAYACEAAATAAYVVARGRPMTLGVGYLSETGVYERFGIKSSNELLASARLTSSFDEVEVPS